MTTSLGRPHVGHQRGGGGEGGLSRALYFLFFIHFLELFISFPISNLEFQAESVLKKLSQKTFVIFFFTEQTAVSSDIYNRKRTINEG